MNGIESVCNSICDLITPVSELYATRSYERYGHELYAKELAKEEWHFALLNCLLITPGMLFATTATLIAMSRVYDRLSILKTFNPTEAMFALGEYAQEQPTGALFAIAGALVMPPMAIELIKFVKACYYLDRICEKNK